jgi:hypothetical protein
MADQEERMTARRKEDTGFSETVDLHDTEVAADTWARAALTQDDSAPKRNIQYDPYTQSERYTGELAGEEGVYSRQVDEGSRTGEKHFVASVRDDDVEAASEIAEPLPRSSRQVDNEEIDGGPQSGASGVGVTGLVLSILSLFMWPYLLGIIGIVLGIIAYRRDARTLGGWAIAIGVIAMLGALLIYPYFMTR